jgi:hypothetical protein
MTLLQLHGAAPQKQPKNTPIFFSKVFTGLFTNRAALHTPSDVLTERYYGGRPDALLAGKNVELTNRLTLARRPGLTLFSSAVYPTAPLSAYSFHLTDGTIQVIVDCGTTGQLQVTSVDNAIGDHTVYHGSFGSGANSNGFVGMTFVVSGFTNNQNNGQYICTGSTSTTLTLDNDQGLAETASATAISAGAVYFDQQSAGNKTLLFSKLPGAGQTLFQAVGGVLYAGDGVSTWKYTPLNPDGKVWNWGITPPSVQPSVTITASSSAATQWQANTYWSTMGLLIDSNNNIQQLISVNAKGNNTTQFGVTGDGEPAWNQTPGGTTTDGTITWTNRGPIVLWTANTLYNNATVGGTLVNPCIVYDPVTKACYIVANPGNASGTSGGSYPSFKPGIGQATYDGTVKWFYLGSLKVPPVWQKNKSYPALGSVSNDDSVSGIAEPVGLANGLPTNQTVFWQTSNGGTSSGSVVAPKWSTIVGTQTYDGDMIWLNLGSKTRTNLTQYTAWSKNGQVFSAIVDSNGNYQVCTTSGTSGSSTPVFAVGYGQTTTDGTVVWTCVGPSTTWTPLTKWFLPKPGFSPPSSSSPFGGAAIVDTNNNVEFIVDSGLGGSVTPTWNTTTGGYTADGGTPLSLTQVTVTGATTTYTGTITGGGSNAFVGRQFLIAGFVNSGNNILITVTASTATTLVCDTTSQVNETHAGTATQGAIWYNSAPLSQNSITWTKGHVYAYSFKARALDDFFSTPLNNALPVPPGLSNALPAPTGAKTNTVSSTSPVFTITGANSTGAVNTIRGMGSTDPQVDTIVIWRDPDGGGASNMFELTEIPAPPPLGGVAQPWVFDDFLPDTPTTQFPGLNSLIPAPINGVNNPPPKGFQPMAFNFQRIWGAVGSDVFFSGGPDIEVGNPNECFLISDSLPFLSKVVRLIRMSQGLLTFTTNSIEMIQGGPATASFYSINLVPAIGLQSYNAADQIGGEIYFFGSDNQVRVISPSLNFAAIGFALEDQFANLPISGVSDATWIPGNIYVAAHQANTDNAIFVADGSTGWYRLNPRTVFGIQGTEPTWSPFAAITNGCKMVQSIEVSPGVKKLLVGPNGSGSILMRDLAVFTDNGVNYADCYFVMGNLILCTAGQIALLDFIEADFSGVSYKPTVSYLLNEISGSFSSFVQNPVFDPPSIYGTTITPGSYSPNRFYFAGDGRLARARHFQLKVDFGSAAVQNEIFNLTVYGRLYIE